MARPLLFPRPLVASSCFSLDVPQLFTAREPHLAERGWFLGQGALCTEMVLR